jgi:exodeoxyribonuclease V beta subunit
MTTANELDLEGALPVGGRMVVEASAGTGKTYSLTALVVRYVAERGLEASDLLIVTFTRAAAAELRDRTRRALTDARNSLVSGEVPARHDWMKVLLTCSDEEREARLRNLDAAVKSFDDATISTIHGFCQQALRQLGLRSGARLGSELVENTADIVDEVCRDLVVKHLAADAGALSWPKVGRRAPSKVLDRLVEAVNALLNNPGAAAMPERGTAVTVNAKDTNARLDAWLDLVDEAVARVRSRRTDRHELGYDDLVTQLRDAVIDPVRGDDARAMLQSRYRLVLVDEFQDTDPVQWQVFGTAFGNQSTVITVGDPKQAIYRFRGADVDAYLRATAVPDKRDLLTNFRSDKDLVTATLGLIGDVQLGDPRIEVGPVRAADAAAQRALPANAPLQIRWVPRHPGLLGGNEAVRERTVVKGTKTRPTVTRVVGNPVVVPLARRAILGDLVRTIVDLLEHEQIGEGDGARPVAPGDIAVLVPSHAAAESVVGALNRAGVPVVRTRTGSVFATEAAQQWRLLLAALERPSYAPYVRAAGMGSFLHAHPVSLDPDSPASAGRVAELQQQCAQWANLLADRSVLTWYHEVRTASKVVEHLLEDPTGERALTDLDHIAELLAAALPGTGHSPAAVRRCLEQFVADAETPDELGPQMRRIDSDAAAVQVTTLHASKGLQYPIVLLPFSWAAPKNHGPLIYNDGDRRIIDVATDQGWNGSGVADSDSGRKHRSDVERRADQLRLLYVGLTRAEHRTIVWWAPGKYTPRAALTMVLFDRDEHGVPLNSPPSDPYSGIAKSNLTIPSFEPTDAEVSAYLDAIVARAPGCIDVATVPERTRLARWSGPATPSSSPLLAAADPRGVEAADPAWRRWSFTGITRTLDEPWSPVAPPAPPVIGGHDEPGNLADEQPSFPAADRAAVPLADVAAGTAFGTLVHEVFERFDPTSADLDAELLGVVRAALRRNRVPVDAGVLARGLALAARTPLGPLAGGLCLADIGPTDRLAELDFDLPLANVAAGIAASDIGKVLLGTLGESDPLSDYAHDLADGRFTVDLAGYLQGSIDAVLRVPFGDGFRYVVVDYKTNRLHQRGASDPLSSYHPNDLVGAMTHSDYPLQALLYSVALHRYLRWRQPGYDPVEHLGGIAYLFVRGMIGPSTPVHDGVPFGVFSWRPPASAVLGLDELFATGRVA